MVTRAAVPSRTAPITSPLTAELVALIGDRWIHGAGFVDIADALIDQIAGHIRRGGVSGMDDRIASAIADAISFHHYVDVDPDELEAVGTAIEPAKQLTIADAIDIAPSDRVTICRTCRGARDAAGATGHGWCAICGAEWGSK